MRTQLDDLRDKEHRLEMQIAHLRLHNAPYKYIKKAEDELSETRSIIFNIR